MEFKINQAPAHSSTAAFLKTTRTGRSAQEAASGNVSRASSYDQVTISPEAQSAVKKEAAQKTSSVEGNVLIPGNDSQTTFNQQQYYFSAILHYYLRGPGNKESFSGDEAMSMANKMVREDTDKAINDLLAENDITIPEGQSFNLTVDPYDFKIQVNGLEDDALAQSIKKLLNRGKNGMNLYNQIYFCNPAFVGEKSTGQYTEGDEMKSLIFHLTKRLTGYDIRDLRNEDGKFYTPDGQDLWTMLEEKADAHIVGDDGQRESIEKYAQGYQRLARDGWDSTSDYDMSLQYSDGHLKDVGIDYGYGYGQTGWQSGKFPDMDNRIQEVKAWLPTWDSMRSVDARGVEKAGYTQARKSRPVSEDKALNPETSTPPADGETVIGPLQDGGRMPTAMRNLLKLIDQYRDLTVAPADRPVMPDIRELELKANQMTREQTEKTVNDLLAENGITIPEGQSFRLTIDPYDFYIRAEGLEDETLAQAIETALNQGQNGIRLYSDLQNCNQRRFGLPNVPQYDKGAAVKASFSYMVKDMTGCDIRTLENRHGNFYTPDGRDLWSVLEEKAAEWPIFQGEPYPVEDYLPYYRQYAKEGWNASPDYNLSLDYVNGHLLDVDTEYGYGEGQTDWQAEFLESLHGGEAETPNSPAEEAQAAHRHHDHDHDQDAELPPIRMFWLGGLAKPMKLAVPEKSE